MSGGDYIAIDWGTTNRRIYLMRADGLVVRSERDDRGVLAMSAMAYSGEFSAIRERFGAFPIIAAGMVGSSRGWREVPYCSAPIELSTLAEMVTDCGENVFLVPGVAQRVVGHADVMRGEEVQVFGALAAGLVPEDGLFCQPGTHNKWIKVSGGRIETFATAMTGELYSLLRQHSILSEMIVGEPAIGPAFSAGLKRSRAACDLVTALFSARASCLLGLMDRSEAASYVSGMLIGSDVAARNDIDGNDVFLLASGSLAALYAQAIEYAGGRTVPIDSQASFAAGIHAIWESAQ
ncbi:2-dehydro-3-deoxygalactonokinase [Tsuneonella mangrovi]|uniref:2-dehydro-3-deoxygalactonokinase n=1 Tax=Tsuneonella mangrovi TaxID=1982042 RepID=UPI001F0B11A3|nr:2-dehydro-3-deoxygalactonokinase [Tsuneonella mangrovi]